MVDPSRVVAVAVLALLLVQPAVPVADAGPGHEGHDHGEHDGNETKASDGRRSGNTFEPNATAVTPNARYVEQRNPDLHGTLLVWEQRRVGHDWDVMGYNLSTDNNPAPIATRNIDERNPTVRGPWIAWERHYGHQNATVDLAVLDTRTGTTLEVPDTGHDQLDPVFGGDATLYYAERTADDEAGHLRAFDLGTRTIEHPIGNHTIHGAPDAYGQKVTWYEETQGSAKVVVFDVATEERTEVPDIWNLKDGPAVGPAGVAFVARHGGAQRGVYTVLYNETRGAMTYMRSGVYPHQHVDQCEPGVVWDQPGSPTLDGDHVALWTRYTERRTTLGVNNSNPSCSTSHLVYEKKVEPANDDLDRMPRIYALDLASIRRPADATITVDPGLEKGIYSDTFTFSGIAEPGDPREPLQAVYAGVDNANYREIETERVDRGVRWAVTLDADNYLSGSHTLEVVTEDAMGTRTREQFSFYTDTPYKLDPNTGGDLDVPRSEPSPFPFNIVDHYKDYQPFYNTVLLVLLIVGGAVYGYYRYQASKPPEPPEYVPPDGT